MAPQGVSSACLNYAKVHAGPGVVHVERDRQKLAHQKFVGSADVMTNSEVRKVMRRFLPKEVTLVLAAACIVMSLTLRLSCTVLLLRASEWMP